MKPALFLILICLAVCVFHLKLNEQSITVSNPIKIEKTNFTGIKESLNDNILDAKSKEILPNQQAINSFTQLLANLDPIIQKKYVRLNEQLFGALDFTNKNNYQIWLEQGFPRAEELEYVSQYNIEELGVTLFNNAQSYPTFKDDPSLNLPAISVLNFVKAVEELEQTIKYYLPDYKQGDPFPNSSHWPNGKRPQQIVEALMQLQIPYAVINKHTAIEYLARARYEQFSFGINEDNDKNIAAILKNLALADNKLGGNSNIFNYVKKHYPEHLTLYESLLNDL